MAIATMIAAVGILTDSAVLIVGAMVVGSELGLLAALCLAAARRRPLSTGPDAGVRRECDDRVTGVVDRAIAA